MSNTLNSADHSNDARWSKVTAWVSSVTAVLVTTGVIAGITILWDVKISVIRIEAQGQPLKQSVEDLTTKMGRTEERLSNLEAQIGLITDRQERALR